MSTNNTSKFNEFGDIDSDPHCEETKFNFEFDAGFLFGHFEDQLPKEESKIEMIDLKKPTMKLSSQVFM